MRAPLLLVAAAAGAVALGGCAGTAPAPAPSAVPTDTDVDVTLTEPGGGPAATYDTSLVPVGATASVTSEEFNGSTTVRLNVGGLLPNRAYGAHAHVNPCGADGMAAGPHYQFTLDPVTPSVDPAFANPQNEIWLDFTTDAQGTGSASTTVPWTFPQDRRPRSVIIHEKPTSTEPGKAGMAGSRAACVTVDF